MSGLLGQIFSAGNVAKRQLRDLLGNPVLGAQQMAGNLNDRARNLNEMTAAAAREGIDYGPATQRLAGLMADAYNPMGLTVFHGSPAKFNRFDRAKIGSGEGAQAYGYGHYVAQSPATAEQYKEMLKSKQFSKIIQNGRNDYSVVTQGGDVIANNVLLGQAHKAKNAFDAKVGSVYEIDLPDEQIAKMLKWDEPLSKQTPEIQALAKQYGLTDSDHLGGDLVAAMNAKRPAGAEAMRQAGVPGISYYDQGSRVAAPTVTDKRLLALYEKHNQDPVAAVDEFMRSVYNTPKKKEQMRQSFIEQLTAPKTSNFVVFPGNEDLLTILRRNGGLLD